MLSQVQHQKEATRVLQKFVDGTLVSPVLLIGPEGVGRRFSVLCAIQEAFCIGTKQPECTCPSCYQILRRMHSDVVLLEAGEKDIGVDEVRTLVAEAQKYPSDGDRRCFIIDGADHLTGPAANALLKTLEEPPAASRFFLIAESAEYVLPTIRSRCGRIRYHPLPEPFVLSVLHQHDSDAKALVYARMGEGSVGRAIYYWGSGRLALRDQVMKLLHAAVERDWPSVFSLVDSLEKDVPLALKFLDQVLHDVLIARVDLGRVINADCVDGLAVMEKKVPVTVWSQLARRVRALQVQYRTSRLYLPFQIKTILIESFI